MSDWLPVLFDAIPSALRALGWVGWRAIDVPERKPRKPAYQIPYPDRLASNSDPTHWRTEGDAREVQIMAAHLFDGFGVALIPGATITFIDLDDVRDPDTGVIAPWALQMVDKFASWSEISASGTGIHIFCLGRLPGGVGKVGLLDGDPTRKVEVYSQGRYAYLTGHALDPVRPLADRQALVTRLAQFVLPLGGPPSPGAAPRDDAPIPAGQRNDVLFRIARGFVFHGLRGADLEHALIAVARRRCVPVPPDRDVVKIARHAERLPDRRTA